jgi:hypothetical protein
VSADTLDNLGAAHLFAVDLVELVAKEQGWPDSALVSGLAYVEEALTLTYGDRSGSAPIAGLTFTLLYEALFGIESGEEFFAYLVALWPTSSTFPDSWNKLENVWISGQETAVAEEEFDNRYLEAAGWAVEETVKDVKQATKVATIGTGTLLAIAGLVYVATR